MKLPHRKGEAMLLFGAWIQPQGSAGALSAPLLCPGGTEAQLAVVPQLMLCCLHADHLHVCVYLQQQLGPFAVSQVAGSWKPNEFPSFWCLCVGL